ncbi:thiamine phosphate synthase [Pedobacter sp. N23S346]|uniref:thiamine phosphate synthase n=1 Tax=Pedobacter sp. N23S346 TaxID=3402750 RepID=UPI003AD2F23C
MELIVISDPESFANEASTINRLFEAGMTRFHLRKPNWSGNQCINLLRDIDQVFHSNIALHQYHFLINEINTKRLHYTEKHRLSTNKEEIDHQKQKGCICSTAVHQLKEISLLTDFDYVFFSPVFNSISKPGYQSKLDKDFILDKVNPAPAIIALGGIDENNLFKIRQMQFNGAAVLGAIWKKPEQAVSIFKKLNE